MGRGGGEPGWKDGRVKMNRESEWSTQGTRKRKGKEVAMWHLEVGAGAEGRGPLVTEDRVSQDRPQSLWGQVPEVSGVKGRRSAGPT